MLRFNLKNKHFGIFQKTTNDGFNINTTYRNILSIYYENINI